MLTLLEVYSKKAYTQMLTKVGLSAEDASAQLAMLRNVVEDVSLVFPPEAEEGILYGIDYFIKKAYIIGLSQAMLTLAGTCVFSAILVYFGLKVRKDGVRRTV
jgi:hypothetical protein